MIKIVRLKNWRSHLDSEFKFTSGTNALFGGMGSGKSSVLNGICFALFGNFPDLQSKKIKLDEIIMNRPVEKDKAEVEVVFEANGKEYSVKRVIERGKGTTYSELRENGNIIEAPNSQRVTEEIEKILKVDYELFTRAIYSEQNALDYFLTIPKGKRIERMDELLMIDKFEEARANAKNLINRLFDRKSEKQKIVEQVDLESLEKNIEEIKNSLNKIISEKEMLKKVLEGFFTQRKILEEEVKELRRLNAHLEELKREERGVESAIEETRKSLSVLEEEIKGKMEEEIERELEESKKIVEEIEKELKEKKKFLEGLNYSVSEAKAKVKFLKSRADELEREIKDKLKLREELGILRVEGSEELLKEKRFIHDQLIGEARELESKLKDLKESIEKLSSVEGKCPVCDSALTEETRKSLIKKREMEIYECKKKLDEVIKKRIENERELEEIERKIKERERITNEIKDLEENQKEYEECKNALEELSKEIVEKENDSKKIREELEKIEILKEEIRKEIQKNEIIAYKFKDCKERKKRLEELLKEKEEIERKIHETESKIGGRNLEEWEKKLREVSIKEKEAEERISGLEKLQKEKEERLKEYEGKLISTKKEMEEIKKLERIISDLRIFEIALKQTQEQMRMEFVEAVNYEMNRIWPTLYPYKDFVEIRLNIQEGDYILQLKDRNNRFVDVDGIASGGERSVACLALRIAFARVLAPQLRWLVLDEPTHNLDSKAVEDLAFTLKTKVGEFVEQVFLISHEEKLEEAVTGYFYKLERNKERDEPTRVIEVS